MEEMMSKYYDQFGMHFPTMCFQTATDEEMSEMMSQCIKANRSAEDLFDLDYENNEY